MLAALVDYLNSHTVGQPDEIEKIINAFEPISYKKNEIISRAGEICKHNYFVIKGGMRFYTINEKGLEFTRYFAFENKFGTALSSFITKKPSIEFIQCFADTELLMISNQLFFDLVKSTKTMNSVYQGILEMAYITSQQRIYGLQSEEAIGRLKWLMTYQPDIFKHVSSKMIASYLGVTTYTLSRLKALLYK